MENDFPRNEKSLGARNYSALPQGLLDTAKGTLVWLKTAARRISVAAALAISLAACGQPPSPESVSSPSHPTTSVEGFSGVPTLGLVVPKDGVKNALQEYAGLPEVPPNAQILRISDHGRELVIVNLGPSPVHQEGVIGITRGLMSFPFSNEPLYLSYEDGTGEHVTPRIIRHPAAQIVIVGAPGQRFANTPPNSIAHTGFHLIDSHLIAISVVKRTGDLPFDILGLTTELCNAMVFATYGEEPPYPHRLGPDISKQTQRIILLQEGICNGAAHALAASASGFPYEQYSATQSGYYSFPKIGSVSSRPLNEENYNALPSIPPVYTN